MMQILKSRTVWTFVALFVIGGLGALDTVIPASAKPVVDLALTVLGIYFHTNPSTPVPPAV